jgi:hypothetical protein
VANSAATVIAVGRRLVRIVPITSFIGRSGSSLLPSRRRTRRNGFRTALGIGPPPARPAPLTGRHVPHLGWGRDLQALLKPNLARSSHLRRAVPNPFDRGDLHCGLSLAGRRAARLTVNVTTSIPAASTGFGQMAPSLPLDRHPGCHYNVASSSRGPATCLSVVLGRPRRRVHRAQRHSVNGRLVAVIATTGQAGRLLTPHIPFAASFRRLCLPRRRRHPRPSTPASSVLSPSPTSGPRCHYGPNQDPHLVL